MISRSTILLQRKFSDFSRVWTLSQSVFMKTSLKGYLLNEPIQFCVVHLLRIFLSHGNDSHGSRSKISPLGDIWVCLHLVLPKCNGAACNRASNFWPMIWRLVDRLRSYDSCSGEFTVHLALVQTSNFSRVFNFQEPYFFGFWKFQEWKYFGNINPSYKNNYY